MDYSGDVKKKDLQLEKEKKKTIKRMERANAILTKHPKAEWQEIYHTLVLLEKTPIERLKIAIQRSGKFAV